MYAAASCVALRISVDCVSFGNSADVADVPDAPEAAAGDDRGVPGAPPPIPNCTGDAAPRLVPGAIAATWLA